MASPFKDYLLQPKKLPRRQPTLPDIPQIFNPPADIENPFGPPPKIPAPKKITTVKPWGRHSAASACLAFAYTSGRSGSFSPITSATASATAAAAAPTA